MSKITKDLNSVAGIIGNLGLSIAQAQRELNLDYLDAIERLTVLARSIGTAPEPGDTEAREKERAFFVSFLTKFAPTRYQYTKTNLDVRLDLAQTLSASGGAGASASLGAVAVNAAFSFSYGSQYQAAAECKTVIDAVMPDADANFFKDLMSFAEKAADGELQQPERATDIDKEIIEKTQSFAEDLLGKTPTQIAG